MKTRTSWMMLLVVIVIIFVCVACSPAGNPSSPSPSLNERSDEELIIDLLMEAHEKQLQIDLEKIESIKGEWMIDEFYFTGRRETEQLNRETAGGTLIGELLTVDDNFVITFQGEEYQIDKLAITDSTAIEHLFFVVQSKAREMGNYIINIDLTKKSNSAGSHFTLYLRSHASFYFWAGEWFNEHGFNERGMYKLKRVE